MTENQPRVLFYFLHLLGVGHIHRAQRLIAQFKKHKIAVDIIYGGMPVPSVNFEADSIHFLPPIQAADNTYATNLDGEGAPLTDSYMERRTAKLLDVFDALNPDLVLIEAYPFGRRVVRRELKALLQKAKARSPSPLIASSVRDILQEKRKEGRSEETRDLIAEFFDAVFVHSDPNIIELDATYPLAKSIADKINYTGFVVPEQQAGKSEFNSDIVVSAGGGAFGGHLMDVAMNLAKTNPFPDTAWCLATGPNLPSDRFQDLQKQAPENVTVVQSVPHLAVHLQAAKISISQCGYNTAMDALSIHATSSCRAVFVPYDTEGQTEQLRRAELLDQAGYAINLPQSQLNPDSLLQAMRAAIELPRVERQIDFFGATNTAKLIKSMIENRGDAR